ncbi:hypothetical protein HMI01_11290 [Halolactibacillus miurensis]|uniref:Uncharacterized protein n=1 Tax=Halolactibacillus miurensis TaxID=306541 RepID=A0A1I6SFN8_9BACI|nr:hypothetical protein [Halolactibacillus miurensis]GEM04141.1 hypothetical protein HMI01_11290 [Halolactibacillus miurensis]SFS75801.1 hypothetical protein SAMN05421668_10914 [Halolactibacillus miurensis]
MDKTKILDESLTRFKSDVQSWKTSRPNPFSDEQKEEIDVLMSYIYGVFDDIRKVIVDND